MKQAAAKQQKGPTANTWKVDACQSRMLSRGWWLRKGVKHVMPGATESPSAWGGPGNLLPA